MIELARLVNYCRSRPFFFAWASLRLLGQCCKAGRYNCRSLGGLYISSFPGFLFIQPVERGRKNFVPGRRHFKTVGSRRERFAAWFPGWRAACNCFKPVNKHVQFIKRLSCRCICRLGPGRPEFFGAAPCRGLDGEPGRENFN